MTILDVAEKYEIQTIRPFIARQLEMDWPTTLEAWIRRQAEVAEMSTIRDGAIVSVGEAQPIFPEPAAAIRLGLGHGIHSILPAAFYELSQVAVEDDWDRIKHEQWKFRDLGPKYEGIPENGKMARWSLLDKDTLMRMLLSKSALYDAEQGLRSAYRKLDCLNVGTVCESQRDHLFQEFKKAARGFSRETPDPLGRVKQLLHDVSVDVLLCKSCKGAIRRKLGEAMTKIWDDLPRIFSVDKL